MDSGPFRTSRPLGAKNNDRPDPEPRVIPAATAPKPQPQVQPQPEQPAVPQSVAPQPQVVAAAEPEPAEAPEKPVEKKVETVRPIPAPRQKKERKAPKLPKRLIAFLIILIIVVGVIAAIWYAFSSAQKANTAIDGAKFQAVLLINGESYIGKLTTLNDKSYRLVDVYYLKSQTATDAKSSQQSTTDQNNVQLIKFGGEVQGPEDEIIISKDQVVYYENLKTDGKAAQAIEQYKKSH